MLMPNFWVTKKSIMLWYGIFWSGQWNVFFFYIGKLDCSLHHCGDCRKLLVGSHISGLSCCKRGRFRIRRDYSLPIMAYTVYGGGGSARKGYLCHPSGKWKDREEGQQGPTDAFYCCEKVEKTFWFCDIFILLTVPLQQLKGMQSSKLGMWKG